MKREDIEKAAREEAEKKECLVYYGGTAISQDDLEESFINGANWRINSVWHDARKEEPIMWKLILRKDAMGDYDLGCETKDDTVSWAYIEDLIPNTEE